MPYQPESDPYFYEKTGVLRNLANIRDGKELERFGTAATLFRQIELAANPVTGKFDPGHLRSVHRYLFQDVYGWAGEFRTVDISKGSTRFGSHPFIASYSQSVLEQLAKERTAWDPSSPTVDLTERLAYYLGEINALHPFREGNGRTQRIFIGQLATSHGLVIRWDTMTPEEMLKASISSFGGDNGPLRDLIQKHSRKAPPAVRLPR